MWSGSAIGAQWYLPEGTGVEALGFWFNAATGNLRHSHVWLPFGPKLERWLLSPAQHQLHHPLATPQHEGVGRQDSRPSGIGQNGEAGASGRGLFGQDFGQIEDIRDGIDPQDSTAPKGGFQDFVAAGQ